MVATPVLLFGAAALGAALWNRLFSPVPWRVVLLFCGLVALDQGETLFTGAVDVPTGITASIWPWKALQGEPVRANTG